MRARRNVSLVRAPARLARRRDRRRHEKNDERRKAAGLRGGPNFEARDPHVFWHAPTKKWVCVHFSRIDGLFSYSAAQFFPPDAVAASFTGDGTIALSSADFRVVKRIWPGVAATSSSVIDDLASTAYTGTWSIATEDRYFHGGCHVGRGPGSALETTFIGTRIEWYGLKNVDLGKVDVYVDGMLRKAGIDLYDARRQNAQLFSVGRLSDGTHTIKLGHRREESSVVGQRARPRLFRRVQRRLNDQLLRAPAMGMRAIPSPSVLPSRRARFRGPPSGRERTALSRGVVARSDLVPNDNRGRSIGGSQRPSSDRGRGEEVQLRGVAPAEEEAVPRP